MASTPSGSDPAAEPEPREGAGDLFFEELVATYLGAPDYTRREWLDRTVLERLARPGCRYVLLTAEPGAGKTGLMAALAAAHPQWPRYFIRRDSTTALSGGDAASMLLRIGHQLAYRQPDLFHLEQLEIEVKQRADRGGGPGASITGVRIEDLQVSPFYRTSIRVEQELADHAGAAVAVDIGTARVEPRLLEPDVLQYLALLDPAAVLSRLRPAMPVVVLIDALDEVTGYRGGQSVLDWLERSPELPQNVRLVLTSRPHPRLDLLRESRGATLEPLFIDTDSPDVTDDVRGVALRLFTEAAIIATGRVPDVEAAASRVATASEGNFAYLTAYARAVRHAAAEGNQETLTELLATGALPPGLIPLYLLFVRQLRRDVDQLGMLDVEQPAAAADALVPAWEGAGQRLLGVLAVARAPLSLDQLIAFGSLRVWRRDAANVLARFRPFLDESRSAWSLFHLSLNEFLTSVAARDVPGVGVDPAEWHGRIVRRYQVAEGWESVEWSTVDDYGLLHLAEHLVELGDNGRRELIELINPGLRAAARQRFLTDLPFRRIVEVARDEAAHTAEPLEAICSTMFLDLVGHGLRMSGRRLDPAVFGLMARLGRVDEALARAELLSPGERQYRCLEAIMDCTRAEDRPRLGSPGGAERLAAAALEVPVTASFIVGFLGFERRHCLESAAVAMAPHNLDRALQLAASAAENDDPAPRDRALAAAAAVTPPGEALALIKRMAGHKAMAALEAADRAEPGETLDGLLELAQRHVEAAEPAERVRALARLVKAREGQPERAATTMADLRSATQLDVDAAPPADWNNALVSAAELVRGVDPKFATSLLHEASAAPVDASNESSLLDAARLWLAWGDPAAARRVLQAVLIHERSLNWYGPARAIAQVADIVRGIGAVWAEELTREAIGLVEPLVSAVDEYEASRLDNTLAGIVDAILESDRDLALRVARWMTGGWSLGSAWRSTYGRSSAVAVIGLRAADDDPPLASALLDECLGDGEDSVVLGRADAAALRGGLFRPAGDLRPTPISVARPVNFAVYAMNALSYWERGRTWRFFESPADVARSVEVAPGTVGSLASWASVVAAAVALVAHQDLDAAADLTGWVLDPAERLIACAHLTTALMARGDDRVGAALSALARAASALLVYEPEVDLSDDDRQPALAYLNPSVRARFEAAIILPGEVVAGIDALLAEPLPGYLADTVKAEATWMMFFRPVLEGVPAEAVVAAVLAELDNFTDHPDDLQRDLVRAAAMGAMAPFDTRQMEAIAASIAHPWLLALGQLFAAANTVGDAEAGQAFQAILNPLPEDVSGLRRAQLAGSAIRLLGDSATAEASALADWGTAALDGDDALSRVRGLTSLARALRGSRRVELLRTALAAADSIGNEYLRDDALADMLAPALAHGDPQLVVEVARRLLQAGWQVMMEGLRRGAAPLLELAGPGIVSELDSAIRRAGRVLSNARPSTTSPIHCDGVAAPGHRDEILVGGPISGG